MKRSWDISQKPDIWMPFLTFRSRFHGNKNFFQKSGRVTFLTIMTANNYMQKFRKIWWAESPGKCVERTEGRMDRRTDKRLFLRTLRLKPGVQISEKTNEQFQRKSVTVTDKRTHARTHARTDGRNPENYRALFRLKPRVQKRNAYIKINVPLEEKIKVADAWTHLRIPIFWSGPCSAKGEGPITKLSLIFSWFPRNLSPALFYHGTKR